MNAFRHVQHIVSVRFFTDIIRLTIGVSADKVFLCRSSTVYTRYSWLKQARIGIH